MTFLGGENDFLGRSAVVGPMAENLLLLKGLKVPKNTHLGSFLGVYFGVWRSPHAALSGPCLALGSVLCENCLMRMAGMRRSRGFRDFAVWRLDEGGRSPCLWP